MRGLYELIDEGKLPGYRFARVIRLRLDEVDEFAKRSAATAFTSLLAFATERNGQDVATLVDSDGDIGLVFFPVRVYVRWVEATQRSTLVCVPLVRIADEQRVLNLVSRLVPSTVTPRTGDGVLYLFWTSEDAIWIDRNAFNRAVESMERIGRSVADALQAESLGYTPAQEAAVIGWRIPPGTELIELDLREIAAATKGDLIAWNWSPATEGPPLRVEIPNQPEPAFRGFATVDGWGTVTLRSIANETREDTLGTRSEAFRLGPAEAVTWWKFLVGTPASTVLGPPDLKRLEAVAWEDLIAAARSVGGPSLASWDPLAHPKHHHRPDPTG